MKLKISVKKIILFAIAVLALAASVIMFEYIFYSQKAPTNNEITQDVINENTGKIVLKEDGFHPSDITITTGNTITFSTTLTRHYWPASDIHPSHGLYPDFDPGEPLNPDSIWSFVFENSGTWKFHDHLAPYFTGSITVLNPGETPATNPDSCSENKNTFQCWQDTLINTLDTKGIDETFNELRGLYLIDESFAGSCHQLAHNIGIGAYKHFIEDRSSVITPKAAFCANGFYHGFMEAQLSADRDIIKSREVCTYFGQELNERAPDTELQCYHGIGHGAMDLAISTGIATDEASLITPALKLCEEAATTDEQLYRCTSGIFNGIANFYISEEFGLKPDKNDPLKLCRAQPEKYKESCYGNMNSLLFILGDGNFSIAAQYIDKMEDEAHKVAAMKYLSGLATIPMAKDNSNSAILACRELDEKLIFPCIEGFAHGFLEHGSPGVEYKEAIAFCETTILTKEEKALCLTYALSNLGGWYGNDKIIEICENVNEEYKEYCKMKRNEN